VLSLGPQQITIPLLEGQPQRLARITLLQSGLQLGEVSVAYLPSSDADTVVQQYPAAGSKAASPRVDLLVSAGAPPAAYIMPSVIGAQAADADRILAAAGFRNVKHNDISQANAATGTVIGQMPPPGGKIDADVSVELGVAANPPQP
jgi:beta-lactam-binding protein with PASTA domain